MQAGDLAAVMRMNNGNVPAVSLIDFDELQQDVRLAEHALVVTDTATSEPHGFCTTFASGITEDLPHTGYDHIASSPAGGPGGI
jgi:Tfp pilus assembly ATPase PilU